MKAVVLHDFAAPLAIEDVETPAPGPGEVLLEVLACGVCHSDLHIVDGDLPGFRAITKKDLVPGHEIVGRVVAVGDGVTAPSVGDRVGVAWTHFSCGECAPCREGRENLCVKAVVTGLMVDGGYAERLVAKASHVTPVPDALDAAEAAPLFCAGVTVLRAIEQAGVAEGQRVAVVGIGGLGHLAVQIARAKGAHVVALDVAADKLALATRLGAESVVDAGDRAQVKALRASGGVHVAVVTAATKAAYDTALRCLRPAGTLAVVGLPPEPLTFPALTLVSGEVHIVATAVGTRDDLRAVLAMAARGEVRCEVETRPLEQAGEVLAEMREGRIAGRVVLVPGAGGDGRHRQTTAPDEDLRGGDPAAAFERRRADPETPC